MQHGVPTLTSDEHSRAERSLEPGIQDRMLVDAMKKPGRGPFSRRATQLGHLPATPIVANDRMRHSQPKHVEPKQDCRKLDRTQLRQNL